jgi:uncharacterized YigZ family protein
MGTSEVVDRKSRFLGEAVRVYSQEEAEAYIAGVRKKHYDARHHCFAWIAGEPGTPSEIRRSGDDGEPSGTAGKPILNQILRRELSDIVVVVVRYFGGVLLGTPGLVNAYRTATEMALEEAEIISYEDFVNYNLSYPYTQIQAVIAKVQQVGGVLSDEQYSNENITATARIPQSAAELFALWLEKQYEITAKLAQ